MGRSGGGLFNARGELIGVCSAADPEIDEGLYAALPRVYYEMDRNGLSFVYQDQQRQAEPTTQQPIAQLVPTDSVPDLKSPVSPLLVPASHVQPVGNEVAPPSRAPRHPNDNTRAAIGSDSDKRELVCVLKSKDGKQSQAYVIDNPSNALLEQLQRESKVSGGRNDR